MMRDIALGLATSISVATMVLTLVDRTTSSAQSAEALMSRIQTIEATVKDHHLTLKARARFVNEATNQLNFICHREPECRALYTPIAVPK